MPEIDFRDRVEKNGVKLKNVANEELAEGEFTFEDYVEKDPLNWTMRPKNTEEVDVEAIAEEMYENYENLARELDCVRTSRSQEDNMYWIDVAVKVPEDPMREKEVAKKVAEAILARNQI